MWAGKLTVKVKAPTITDRRPAAHMKNISQTIRFRQAVVECAMSYGVSFAAKRYDKNRQFVYRWLRRYDGTRASLKDRSRRPHFHPNQHTEPELKLVFDMYRRNKGCGLVVFWVKLVKRGYSRNISSLYRVLKRYGMSRVKTPNPKYIAKPYEKMHYPGQRVQIDVKVVPSVCISDTAKDKKYYQYTAIDEYSRFRYLEV